MKVALFGVTGMIGSRVTAELLARGHIVTAAVRKPESARVPDHERLTVVRGDVTDRTDVERVSTGHDAVVSAVGGLAAGRPVVVDAAHALLEALPAAGVERLVVVGGAGSLEAEPGLLLMDAPFFPAEWRGGAEAGKAALDVYREAETGVDWTFISPAHEIDPGERTGRYRVGFDQVLWAGDGSCEISAEDYAVALVDVLERGEHLRRRITVAY